MARAWEFPSSRAERDDLRCAGEPTRFFSWAEIYEFFPWLALGRYYVVTGPGLPDSSFFFFF